MQLLCVYMTFLYLIVIDGFFFFALLLFNRMYIYIFKLYIDFLLFYFDSMILFSVPNYLSLLSKDLDT